MKSDDFKDPQEKKKKEFDPFKQDTSSKSTAYNEHTKKAGRKVGMISIASILIISILFSVLIITKLKDSPDDLKENVEADKLENDNVEINKDIEVDTNPIEKKETTITGVKGKLYPGRTIDIIGEGFSHYDPDISSVTIDGNKIPIMTWGDSIISVVLPSDITKGEKEITIMNPPFFEKKTTNAAVLDHPKKELVRGNLLPEEETIIEGDSVKIVVPSGSIKEETELIIYRYESTPLEESEIYTVVEEYEIANKEGNHVFFDRPVFFGIDVKDSEDAKDTIIQYFDEAMGVWVEAETAYNPDDNKLYVKTKHFSPWRKLKNRLKKKISEGIDNTIETGKSIVKYPYKIGKSAVEKVVELSEEGYIIAKDNLVENFIGVSGENVIVFYRESDAKKDSTIPDTAKKAAAAYDISYRAYAELFGMENMPNAPRLVRKDGDFFDNFLNPSYPGPTSKVVPAEIEKNPIKVYIDPNYNQKGANYSILSGNISMPSKYPDNDLSLTCAHELFHAVQHHQYGLKMLYMANGYKDTARSMLGSDKEVSKYLANNKWFFEATAEFAGRFIGTNIGIGVIHSGTEASSPYYAFSGTQNGQEYGMAAFIDYIATNKNEDITNRGIQFRNLWNYVLNNYSGTSSVNNTIDKYIKENMNTSAVSLYGEFWRDVVTQASMPAIPLRSDKVGSSALVGIQDFVNLKRSRRMHIKNNGYGIFRIPINDKTMPEDETAISRSIWLELSDKNILGSVYRLQGLDKDDRVDRGIKPIGYVNGNDRVLKEALVPYKNKDSFALITQFKGRSFKEIKLECKVTSLTWDNQQEIEKKAKNTTLDFKDKLKFTPVLPKQKSYDEPFRAVVILNNDKDFTREIDRVENGKTFEVDPPMYKDSNLPPDDVKAKVQIFQGDKLIHEYISKEKEEDEIIDLEIDLTSGDLETGSKAVFTANGIPSDINITKILWRADTKPKKLFKKEMETKSNKLKVKFREAMTLNLSVNVFGKVDGKETLIGMGNESYSIEEKKSKGGNKLSAIAGEWIKIGYYGRKSIGGPKEFIPYNDQMMRIGRSLYFDGSGNMVYTHAVERKYNSQTGEYGEITKAYEYEGKYFYDEESEYYKAEVDNRILYERFLHEVGGFVINITEHEGQRALEVTGRNSSGAIYIKKQ